MKKNGKYIPTVLYQLDEVRSSVYPNAPANQAVAQAIILQFVARLETLFKPTRLEELHLFLSPCDFSTRKDFRVFQRVEVGRKYRDDLIKGVFWTVGHRNRIVAHFPYSLQFTTSGVAIDAGPEMTPSDAAWTVYTCVRHSDHSQICSMTPEYDLVTRYILPLLKGSKDISQTTLV